MDQENKKESKGREKIEEEKKKEEKKEEEPPEIVPKEKKEESKGQKKKEKEKEEKEEEPSEIVLKDGSHREGCVNTVAKFRNGVEGAGAANVEGVERAASMVVDPIEAREGFQERAGEWIPSVLEAGAAIVEHADRPVRLDPVAAELKRRMIATMVRNITEAGAAIFEHADRPVRLNPVAAELKRRMIATMVRNYAEEATRPDMLPKPPEKEIPLWEWIFVVSNLTMELPSAVFDQLSSPHKPLYALMAMTLSLLAFLLCVTELVYRGVKAGITFKWPRSRIPWFYYLSRSDQDLKRFGTFADIIGLVCAICQCIVTAINYNFARRAANSPIKFSLWPIIFALGVLCSRILKTV